jgi:hypothetical protein
MADTTDAGMTVGTGTAEPAAAAGRPRRRALSYSSFERLVLVVAAVAVGGTVAASALSGRTTTLTEVTGALLVFAVLAAAVHWGRNGGFLAAAGATLIYTLMAVPGVVIDGGLQPQVVQLVLVHVIVYGLVGVVGGEVCGRLKYTFARLENSSALDYDSRLYSEAIVRELLCSGIARYRRYGTPMSVIRLDLALGLFAEYRPFRRRALLRRVAQFVRNDVRLVDDIGRLDDGAILIVLASTPEAGAQVVADRLRSGVSDLLQARDDAITTEVLSTDTDADAVARLADDLKSADAPVDAELDEAM